MRAKDNKSEAILVTKPMHVIMPVMMMMMMVVVSVMMMMMMVVAPAGFKLLEYMLRYWLWLGQLCALL